MTASTTIIAVQSGEARRATCIGLVRGFEHDTATVAERQEYAACVERLYPSELSPGAVIALKVVIVCALLGTCFGAWKGWKDDGAMGAVFIGLFGALVAVWVPVTVLALVYGFYWVVTA